MAVQEETTQPQETLASDTVPENPEVTPADFYVVPIETLNAIVGYLMEQPWRQTNQLLRSLEGIRSLDEYLVR